jgi:co-chaperonin GroES (HSP10)
MSVIPFVPIGPVVVVLPHASAPTETASGIVLADVDYDPATSGTVIAVGSQFCCASCAAERDSPFAIGDRVLFGRGAGSEVDGAAFGVVGDTFLLMREDEILAVLDEAALCEVV